MADQLNDLMFTKLAGYAGDTLNDRLVSWLRSEGGTGDDLNTLWHSMWDVKLVPGEQFNDRMVAWLLSESAVGDTYNDLQYSFWTNFIP